MKEEKKERGKSLIEGSNLLNEQRVLDSIVLSNCAKKPTLSWVRRRQSEGEDSTVGSEKRTNKGREQKGFSDGDPIEESLC